MCHSVLLGASSLPRRLQTCQHHSVDERDELLVGLYDELVTDALQSIVNRLEAASRAQLNPLPPAEASSRLAEHVGRVVSIVLESLSDEERTTTGLAIVQDVIELLAARSPEALDDLRLASPATLLSAVERRLPDGSYQSIDRPLTALRDSTLLVNAPGEPRVLHELIAEVPSAHSIDVLVAFVRLSGIAPMLTALAPPSRQWRPSSAPHHHLHEQHPGRGARRTHRRWRRGPCLLRPDHHPPPRQGVDLQSRPWAVDRLRRIVEPHPQRDGAGLGVERPPLLVTEPRRHRQDGGRLRDVLGERRLRALRHRGVP